MQILELHVGIKKIMKIQKIIEFHVRIIKNHANTRVPLRIQKINEIHEFHERMLKIIITMEFNARITKIMKIL